MEKLARASRSQSEVQVSRGGHDDFKGKGGLGVQVLGIGHLSDLLVAASLD